MGSHISFRKIRKTVHKVMLKYGKKKFYRKIDWIEKVLKKLRVRTTPNIKARVRNHVNKWLSENSKIVDTKIDSKKDSKPTVNPIDNKDDSTEKKNEGNNSNSNQDNQLQAQVQEQVGASKPVSLNRSIPPMPEAVLIKSLKNKIPVIDLTFDDKKEVKKNEVEVITVDDDNINVITVGDDNLDLIAIDDDNVNVAEILPQQPSIMDPQQYYAIPNNYSYYDFYQNNYFFHPVIVQPDLVNF